MTLARHGNFTRAADEANLSQSAFSRSIQNLEAELGVGLFDRQGKSVTPTRFGDELLRHAGIILAEFGELKRDVQMMSDLQHGELAVGAGVYPAEVCVNSALARLHREYPRLNCRIFVGNWEEIAARVLAREVDVGFISAETDRPDTELTIEPISAHRLVPYVRSNHPLTHLPQVTRADIDAFPLVSIRAPAHLAADVPGRTRLERRSNVLLPAVEVDDLGTARTIVAGSDAVGVAIVNQIEVQLTAGELAILDCVDMDLAPTFSIVRLRDRLQSPAAIKLTEYVLHADIASHQQAAGLMARFANRGAGS